jgi:hypothetical protein
MGTVPVLQGKDRRCSTQHPRGVHPGETSGRRGLPAFIRFAPNRRNYADRNNLRNLCAL